MRYLLYIFGVFCGSVAVAADPPRPTVETVRATIQRLWSNNADEVAVATTALEADPLALPVIRRALATDSNPRHQGVLERLAETAAKRRDKVLAKRVEQWAKDGRLDLLTEVRSLTDSEAAVAALDRLLRATKTLAEQGSKQLSTQFPDSRGGVARGQWVDGKLFRKDGPKPVFDSQAVLLETFLNRDRVVFADRIDAPCRDLEDSFLVCRSELTHFTRTAPYHVGRSGWSGCAVYANTAVQCHHVSNCLIVLDGDLELVSGARIEFSLVVVNGRVTDFEGASQPGLSHSLVWATGDVPLALPRWGKPHPETLFLSGGQVANADKLAVEGAVSQNVKTPPLPVRFFDPIEFGLTMEATEDGMKVGKVADTSAFADVLRVGDVITRVGEVETATAPAFRRELRRGILDGAVIFDVIRGKEKLELLAAVPDVPPASRKEKELKAAPPEKKDK